MNAHDLALYFSLVFMLAGLAGMAILVLEFAIRHLQATMAPIDPIVPERPRSTGRHYGWGAEITNPYAEYSVRNSYPRK